MRPRPRTHSGVESTTSGAGAEVVIQTARFVSGAAVVFVTVAVTVSVDPILLAPLTDVLVVTGGATL